MANKGKKINVSLRSHQAALRRLGFRLDYASRSKLNGNLWEYVGTFPEDEVQLRVQLWSDSYGNRVTYRHANLFTDEPRAPYGHETTLPEMFSTVDEMLVVIEHQRRDWLAVEKYVETEYVRQCMNAGEDRADSRQVLRERIKKMPRFRVLRADRAAVSDVKVGELYFHGVDGYGLCRDDARVTGLQHIMLSATMHGTPSFTIPLMDVERIDPKQAFLKLVVDNHIKTGVGA